MSLGARLVMRFRIWRFGAWRRRRGMGRGRRIRGRGRGGRGFLGDETLQS